MTETEWLACEDPELMLERLPRHMSGRKGCLLGCACCRRNWKHLRDARLTVAVETIERVVDGLAPVGEVQRVSVDARAAHDFIWSDASEQRWWYVSERAAGAVVELCGALLRTASLRNVMNSNCECSVFASDADGAFAMETERRAQASLIRDIFGNPFRPVSFAPEWRTSTAVALAAQMYESRDFSAMPILADALQDAGCDNDDILNHCRDAQPTHVRGCWVVDLVLGKS